MKSVALDAGHYSKTAGKRSPDNTYFEYEFNWDMCLKIRTHLERCGIKVYFTRNDINDADGLVDRVKLANTKNVDLFFSVHSNAFGTGGWEEPRGYSVHVYKNAIDSSNAADVLLKTVFPEMTDLYGLKNRGKVTQDLYVLRETKMTALLVEHAFHTNKEDVKLLKSQDFREKIAELDAKGICNYLGVTWKNENNKSISISELKDKGYTSIIFN